MTESRGPRWRAWTAALLMLVLPLVIFLLTRSGPPEAAPAPVPKTPVPQAVKRGPPAQPVTPSALVRADLIEAARQAASAYATQAAAPASNLALAGRRFSLRLPFGCAGPAERPDELGPAGWHYDSETETLRAQVTPEVWTETPWALAASGQSFEAAEGFWITRPWTTSTECPRPNASAARDPATSPQTLGIARFFEPGSSRAARRNGLAYRVSKKVAPEQAPGAQGLRLLIEGRLSVDPSRQPIGCWSPSADVRPVCVFNGRFDRIAITDASGETVYSEWKD